MGFVGNHGKAFALCRCQLAHGLQCEGKSLDGADHNFFVTGQGFSQGGAFAAVGVLDGGHHAGGALKVEQRFLQL